MLIVLLSISYSSQERNLINEFIQAQSDLLKPKIKSKDEDDFIVYEILFGLFYFFQVLELCGLMKRIRVLPKHF